VHGGSTLAEKVASVKAELLRVGPLCAAASLDRGALSAIRRVDQARTVASTRDGVFYTPRDPLPGVYLFVLIVGYVDDGNGAAFWVCKSFVDHAVGYRLSYGQGQFLDDVFNMAMYADTASLLDRIASFDRVEVQLRRGGETRPLGSEDPLVSKTLAPSQGGGGPLAGRRAFSAEGPGRFFAKPSRAFRVGPWLAGLFLACSLLLGAALFVVVFREEGGLNLSKFLPLDFVSAPRM